MTIQYIQEHLNKPRSWRIVLTGPHAELRTKAILERKGLITYLPFAAVRRRWAGRTKEIHIPAAARCVFIYASNEEIQSLKGRYPVLPAEVIK